MNNLEKSMIENRESRELQHGRGSELLKQVEAREAMVADEESLKYYRRKGVSTISGFNASAMYQDGFEPIKQEDDNILIPNKYAKEGQRTIFGHDPVSGQKVDNMPHEGSILGSIMRIPVGAAYDVVRGSAQFGQDIADKFNIPPYLDPTGELRQKFLETEEPEFLRKSAGWGENMARDVTQFAVGYGGAYSILGKIGLKAVVGKDILAAVASGQTFNPKEGNLFTLLNDHDLLPDTMKFLDAKLTSEEEGVFEGRIAMALEEVGIGAGIYAARAANRIRKTMQMQYKTYGKTVLKNGVMKYNGATSAINSPTRGISGDKIIDEDAAQSALNEIAVGFQISGGKAEDYVRLIKEAGIDENKAKKAWNVASKEKLEKITGMFENDN